MNVGEYVRTKDGIIAKITDIIEDLSIDCDRDVYDLGNMAMMEIPWNFKDEYIIKSSPQIIDLIEVGDYVNGRKVSKINLDRTLNKEKCILCADTNYDCLDTVYKNEDIKSIVTHEQMKAMQYRVEE
jgi:hypothetical protein